MAIIEGMDGGLPSYGSSSYYTLLQELLKKQQQQSQQIPQTTPVSQTTTPEDVTARRKPGAHRTSLMPTMPQNENSFWQNLVNLFTPSTQPGVVQGGLLSPAAQSMAINPTYGQEWWRINKFQTMQPGDVKSNADLARQHPGWFDYLRPNVYGVLGTNSATQKFNPSSPTFDPSTPFFTPLPPSNFGYAPPTLPDMPLDDGGGGGYTPVEYPAWNFGGGGGGGRRSSGGIGRSKQLASWYQAMTNWNINRPQSG